MKKIKIYNFDNEFCCTEQELIEETPIEDFYGESVTLLPETVLAMQLGEKLVYDIENEMIYDYNFITQGVVSCEEKSKEEIQNMCSWYDIAL